MIFIADWDKNRKKTWSGTTYSLYQALSSLSRVTSISSPSFSYLQKLKFYINSLLRGQASNNMNFNYFFLESKSFEIKRTINDFPRSDGQNILQIGDLAKLHESGIYQDLSISFILYCRDKDPEAFKYSGFQDISLKELYARNEVQMKRYSDARFIFTMSMFLRDFLVDNVGIDKKKVVYAGGGINIKNVDSINPIRKNRKRILFVGRDFIRKGGDLVVAAFKILKNKFISDAELYIIGPQKIDKKYLGDGINILGDLDSNKVEYYYNLCDIFCMPSRFEAFGLVFIEALTRGLPCIGRNKFEMSNIIEPDQTGYLVDNDNVTELASKMFNLLNNDKIYSNVKLNKAYYTQKYSWDSVARNILEAFNK